MNFRRYYFPGQIVFITQVVKDRHTAFHNPVNITLLRDTLHTVNEKHKFTMLAYTFLPDHFHLLIQPTGESTFSQIMHAVKFRFTRAYKRKHKISEQLNFWQKRYWDHIIRDDKDLENHIHYIHHNPVKHGYVADPLDWIWSSYRQWIDRGAYVNSKDWKEPEVMKWGE